MWTRSELKYRGKKNFKSTYVTAVIVSLILMIFTSGMDHSSDKKSSSTSQTSAEISDVFDGDAAIITDTLQNSADRYINEFTFGVGSNLLNVFRGLTTFLFGLLFLAFGILIRLFIVYPLEIGGRHFYISDYTTERSLSSLLFSYRSGSLANHVITLLKRDVFIFLWMLLLIVPGIIKAYEYRMVPYLLAADPGLDSQEAFRQSREMMSGQKMNTFILDLSFIPWLILSGITLNVAGIFYVNPYIDATNAELYKELLHE